VPLSARDGESQRTGRLIFRPITVEGLKYLRHFQRSTFAEASRAHPRSSAAGDGDAHAGFLHVSPGAELKTPGFLRQIRREEGGATPHPGLSRRERGKERPEKRYAMGVHHRISLFRRRMAMETCRR